MDSRRYIDTREVYFLSAAAGGKQSVEGRGAGAGRGGGAWRGGGAQRGGGAEQMTRNS